MPKLLNFRNAFLICLTINAFAATQPDFSGSYAAKQRSHSKSRAEPLVLLVLQSGSAVEVTRINGNKSTTNHFPLDGSEGDYVTETGVRGRCKAYIKKDTLVLESLVASSARAGEPSIRFRTIEQWQLSADGNTLTIKTEIKSPDMPAEIMAAAFPNNPGKEQYERTHKP